MNRVLRGGRVIDPASGVDREADVVIEQGRIAAIASPSPLPSPPARGRGKGEGEIDCRGLWVVPGLIDLHVHLREPGHEYKETIRTGTEAAAAGGFTTICCMPNTDPVNDHASVTEFILDRARREGRVRVRPIGAITKGSRGEELAEIGELKDAGCVAVSDDGRPVSNAEVMRRAMEYAKTIGLPVIDHCEDPHLAEDGVMHEGLVATELGLRGIPAAAEEVIVARDIALAELTGCRVHLAHLSCAGSVRRVREAKARGVPVTAEVTPHHLTLTDERVRGFDPDAKMNPPLRTPADLEALVAGLADGTVDAVATDHAPHASEEKGQEFDRAPFGVVGLETAAALVLRLVRSGHLERTRAIAALSCVPAKVLGLEGGSLAVGSPADLAVIDPEAEWVVDPSRFRSRSRNTPFAGWKLQGRVVMTIVGGEVVYRAEGG